MSSNSVLLLLLTGLPWTAPFCFQCSEFASADHRCPRPGDGGWERRLPVNRSNLNVQMIGGVCSLITSNSGQLPSKFHIFFILIIL